MSSVKPAKDIQESLTEWLEAERERFSQEANKRGVPGSIRNQGRAVGLASAFCALAGPAFSLNATALRAEQKRCVDAGEGDRHPGSGARSRGVRRRKLSAAKSLTWLAPERVS